MPFCAIRCVGAKSVLTIFRAMTRDRPVSGVGKKTTMATKNLALFERLTDGQTVRLQPRADVERMAAGYSDKRRDRVRAPTIRIVAEAEAALSHR